MSEPLDGAVEVDWQRPLDEWETAFKDELFLWGPFFADLGHAHLRMDANAKYALARIAGVLHRADLDAANAEVLRLTEALEGAERERDRIKKQVRSLVALWRGSAVADSTTTHREAGQFLFDLVFGDTPTEVTEAPNA